MTTDDPAPAAPPREDGEAPASAPHRSGIVSIVGRPNVGKSTLLNAIIGEKVAIATRVPQTTRHVIRGILTRPDVQMVFVDTPGIHKPKSTLSTRLNDLALEAVEGVDLILLVLDGADGIGPGDRYLSQQLLGGRVPVIAVVNKVDRLHRNDQLPAIAAAAELGGGVDADGDAVRAVAGDFAEIVPVSGRTGESVDVLLDLVAGRLPEGPPLYPEEMVTDLETTDRVAELVREKTMLAMREEVPHSIAVTVDDMGPGRTEGVTAIFASIFVERESQKGMVIGKGGAMLADIGTSARPEIEALLGGPVYLDLRVKLAKDWQSDPKQLNRLGY